ncbi:MAG: hypothetical protein J7K04_03125 [Spirochaetales bacterium]|nr:hypothetical protein [Spirochaetales bacterium]
MKTFSFKLYYIIPVLYLIIILLFVYLQFNSTEKIHKDIGNLSIYIEKSRKTRIHSASIKNADISYGKFGFTFSAKFPLKIKAEGKNYSLYLKDYSFFDNGLDLYFDNNVSMEFREINTVVEKFTLEVKADTFIKNIQKNIPKNLILSVPFYTALKDINLLKNIPAALYNNGTISGLISLPDGAHFDLENGVIHLRYKKNLNRIIIKSVNNGKEFNPYLYWFYTNLKMPDKLGFTNELKSYIEKAYTGWSTARFNKTQNGWNIPEKTSLFKENIVASALSVAMEKNKYGNISSEMLKIIRKEIAKNPEENIPFFTSVFYGGLKKYLTVLNHEDTVKISEITKKIKLRDKSVFKTNNIVTMILDRGPFSLLEELAKFAETIDFSKENLENNINLLNFYVELSDKLGSKSAYSVKMKKIIDKEILPSALSFRGQMLLMHDNRENIYITFNAGVLILKFLNLQGVEVKDKDMYFSIARKLITSSLSFADSSGLLPFSIYKNKYSGYLTPEKLYPQLAELLGSYYPEEKPLYKYLTPGAWLWTVSHVTKIAIKNNTYSFTFKYPEKQTQFILIQGIKPFKQIIMHGIVWKPDPAYYRYSDGWFYDNNTGTLFIKITQGKKSEEVKILF